MLGVLILALPHIIGAPGGQGIASVGDGPARSFALASLAVSFVMWITIGIVTVVVMKRLEILRSITGTASNAGT